MVYSGGYVVAIAIRNGAHWQHEKERKDGIVTIPMGQEYAIYLRNKTKRRVLAKVYIDGENISGLGYILRIGQSFHLERYADEDKAFKLVAYGSKEAQDGGKNYVEEGGRGVIEVRFYPEEEKPTQVFPRTPIEPIDTPLPKPWKSPWKENPYPYPYKKYDQSLTLNPTYNNNSDISCQATNQMQLCTDFAPMAWERWGDNDSVTVGGNITGQTFGTGWIETENECIKIVLTLKGDYNKKPSVSSRYCNECGSKAKRKSAKFCSQCGRRL